MSDVESPLQASQPDTIDSLRAQLETAQARIAELEHLLKYRALVKPPPMTSSIEQEAITPAPAPAGIPVQAREHLGQPGFSKVKFLLRESSRRSQIKAVGVGVGIIVLLACLRGMTTGRAATASSADTVGGGVSPSVSIPRLAVSDGPVIAPADTKLKQVVAAAAPPPPVQTPAPAPAAEPKPETPKKTRSHRRRRHHSHEDAPVESPSPVGDRPDPGPGDNGGADVPVGETP